MIFLCPFLHCKALRTAMYKRYINIIIIIIIIKFKKIPAYHFIRHTVYRQNKSFSQV